MAKRPFPPAAQNPDPIDAAEKAWVAHFTEREARIFAIGSRLLRVASLVERSFAKEVQPLGLTGGEMNLLDALRRLGAPYQTSPARLKQQFLMSFAGVGKRIAQLEELGYVCRLADDTDGRSQIIRLTKDGLALLHSYEQSHETLHRRALEQFTDEELASLGDQLRRIHQIMSAPKK